MLQIRNADNSKLLNTLLHTFPPNLEMKAACVQCRVRKVRCDGTVPRCRTCERLNFQCSFEQDGSGGNHAPRLPPKCRGAKACQECRTMKVRCSGDTPRCTNCQRRKKPCTYLSRAGSTTTEASSSRDDSSSKSASRATVSPELQRSSIASSSTSNATNSSVVEGVAALSYELVVPLVNQFFDRMSPLPSFSFLHQATVTQRCRDKTIDRVLQLALCAITSIYFDKHQEEHAKWAQEAEHLILERLEEPSIFKIQASLLLIRYRAAVGEFPRAFIMAGLAARWAVALRLNYEHSKLTPVAQEVRRRTFWSLYLLEDSFCVGLKEFELFDPDTIYLQLPCEDVDFLQERYISTGYLQPGKGLEPDILGPRAAFVRLAFIRRAIMRLSRRISMKEANLSDLFSSMERFQTDLLRLKTKLAPCDQYSDSGSQRVRRSPQCAAMHMSWHQSHCNLYRIFLTEYPEPTPHATVEGISASERAVMKDKCLFHAEQIVQLLSDFIQHNNGTDLLDFDVAICAYHSARLILFGAYTSKDNKGPSMQMAISKAQLCLDVITRYFRFSEQLRSMRQELERVVQQHKTWIESLDNRDIAATGTTHKSPHKLSKDAYIRQRLAIHSLLGQSDFVDDSRDAAPAPPPEQALSTTESPEDGQAAPEPPVDGDGRELYLLNDPIMDPSILFGISYGAGSDLDAWAHNAAIMQGINGYLADVDEQYMY